MSDLRERINIGPTSRSFQSPEKEKKKRKYRNIPKYWDTKSIGTPLLFVKIIIFRHPKNWDISKIAKIFSNFLYHMNWDSAFG